MRTDYAKFTCVQSLAVEDILETRLKVKLISISRSVKV